MPLPLSLKASDLSLEKLEANPHLSEPEKIAEVSRQFEAVLLRQILSQARKTVVDSEFNTDSTANSIYQDMINYQLADSISRTGSFGLAHSVEQQLTRQTLAHPDPAPQAGTRAAPAGRQPQATP